MSAATHPHANALVDRARGENVGIVLVPVDAQNLIVVCLDRVHRTLICANGLKIDAYTFQKKHDGHFRLYQQP